MTRRAPRRVVDYWCAARSRYRADPLPADGVSPNPIPVLDDGRTVEDGERLPAEALPHCDNNGNPEGHAVTPNMTNTDLRPAHNNHPASRAVPSPSIRLTWAPEARPQPLAGLWWPRSRDAASELPELIAAASLRLGGPVTRVSLNIDAWDPPHDTRLSMAGQVIRLGWFHHIDPHLITAGRGTHDRLSIALLPADLDTLTVERIMNRLQSAPHWPTTPATLLDFGTQSPAKLKE